MATEGSSRLGQLAKLAVVLLVVTPVLVQFGFVAVDFAPALDFLPQFDADSLVRLGGFALVLVVIGALVRQKRRARGQQASERAAEEASDRKIEGTGEVYAPYAYNNQQQARREGKRIEKRAEEIAEMERERRR